MNLTTIDKTFDTLLLSEPSEHVLQVMLNRPDAVNALTTQMGHEIIDVFAALTADPLSYRCVIFTAAGDRIFCGGADLKERDGMTDEAFQKQHYLFERMMRAIWECPIPTIAAINGHCIAGGLELVLNCDFAYAPEGIKFGFPEVKRGIMPGGSGTQHLPRLIGSALAKEIILTGENFTADEAVTWGVVNRLFPKGTVLDEALKTAKTICANAPLSTAQAKKSITHGMQMDLRTGMFFEIESYYRLIPTEDRQEGINAFVEKRPTVFKGR